VWANVTEDPLVPRLRAPRIPATSILMASSESSSADEPDILDITGLVVMGESSSSGGPRVAMVLAFAARLDCLLMVLGLGRLLLPS